MMNGRLRSAAVLVVSLVAVAACGSSATPAPSVSASPPAPSTAPVASTPVSSQHAGSPPAHSTGPNPHWVAAGSMIAARHDPQAVRLSGDRVLVVGNEDLADGFRTTAEIWDPATNAWTATEGLPKVRTEFVAVAIGDDRVLVDGGLNADELPQSYSSAYIFDGRPGHGTWTKTGTMDKARSAPSAAVLPDGRLLVAGGYFSRPTTGSIDGGPTAALAAWHGTATGGSSPASPGLFDVDPGIGGAALATAELFDPATGTWSATGPLKYAREGAPAVTLTDGRVLVVGSSSFSGNGQNVVVDGHAFETAETYDPATGRFTLAGSLPKIDRAALAKQATKGANPMPEDDGEASGPGILVALADGGAVLIARTNYWKHVADMTRSFRFDASSGTWSEIGQTYVFVGEPTRVPLWTPGVPALVGACVATLHDGRVLVAGGQGPNLFGETGYNSTPTTAAARLYDPATNVWSDLPAMPEPRPAGASVVLSDGSVLVVGGSADTTDGSVNVQTAVRFVP